MRFFKRFSIAKYDPKQIIKHVIVEVIIVVVGILIAFQLDEWKDGRAKREIELKTLLELESAVKIDMSDISLNDTIHTLGAYSTKVLSDHIENKKAYHDSLADHLFTVMYSYSLFLPNTSAYETLKSRGLETVTNDSLRLMLGELYDVKYEQIYKNESDLRSMIFNDVFTYFKKNFVIEGLRAVPLNYNSLLNDTYFKNLLLLNRLAQQGSAKDFRTTLVQIKNITRLIRQEIKRLE